MTRIRVLVVQTPEGGGSRTRLADHPVADHVMTHILKTDALLLDEMLEEKVGHLDPDRRWSYLEKEL